MICERYGKSTLVYLPRRVYVTSKPEEIKVILNSPFSLDKLNEYGLLKELQGDKTLFRSQGILKNLNNRLIIGFKIWNKGNMEVTK